MDVVPRSHVLLRPRTGRLPAIAAIGLTFAAASCSGGPRGAADPRSPGAEAPGEALTISRPAPVASSPRPAAPDRVGDEALVRCEAALERTKTLPASEAFSAMATGCADVAARPACREAWRRVPELPVESRAVTLATACADAYCPALAAPAPALCTRDDRPTAPSELGPLWAELHMRILIEDLGPERARRILDRFRDIAASRRPPAAPAHPQCHVACCPPHQQGPGPDGTTECCLCD